MLKHRHFRIYKPFGYLSQFTNNQTTRKNKSLLGELGHFPEAIMAIGRLDQDSEGLLLLTTDGMLSEEVRSKEVEKEYCVQLDGEISQQALAKLREGVSIAVHGKEYLTLPCEVRLLEQEPNFPERGKPIRSSRHGPHSWISIILTEGKYRQVRKMTAAVGYPTLRLVRVRIGNEKLEPLQPGQVQEVSSFSI